MLLQFLKFCLPVMLVFSACSKNKDAAFRTGEIQPPMVTGYIERNYIGEEIRVVGRPSVKLGDKSNDYRTSDYFITTYPTPVRAESKYWLNIHLKSPNNNVKKVWLTAANHSNEVNISGTSAALVGGSPLISLETTGSSIVCDLKDFPAGLYRVYCQADEHLLFDDFLLVKN